MTFGNFEIETVTAPRHFIRLTYRGGTHDKVQCAWGRKAASAIRRIEKMQRSGDDEALKLFLTLKSCNGF